MNLAKIPEMTSFQLASLGTDLPSDQYLSANRKNHEEAWAG